MSESSKRIELSDLSHVFRGAAFRQMGGELTAVDHVSFRLTAEPPQIVNLVGESGSGKSTLARIILGLQRPTSGSITYCGKDVYRLTGAEFRQYRREVQVVFQDPYGIFNPFYRVDRIFWTAIKKFGLASSEEKGRALIEQSLAAVDLRPEDVLGRYPHQLSGGQRQRVMLARVHMLRPSFIIADEPVSMLDAAVRVLFLNILLDFKERYGMTTLFITHDLSTAYYLGGEIMVISNGRIVERGSTDDVLLRPAHPYTQQLLSSLPVPEPEARWHEMLKLTEDRATTRGRTRARCLFAERCPMVMEQCWEQRPELVTVGPSHEARCFLYGAEATEANPSRVLATGDERK
ncbi:MAG TPA: ABC transporter ATP-binding protein [Chloroflexota bacterium]|nr:ABC transporter ATP-binding protein [Chloroflexota bacterium]